MSRIHMTSNTGKVDELQEFPPKSSIIMKKNEIFHLLQSIINTSGRLDLYPRNLVIAINT